MSKKPIWTILTGSALTIGAFFLGGFQRERVAPTNVDKVAETPVASNSVADQSDDTGNAVRTFKYIADELEEHFVEEIDDPTKLATGSIKGMVNSLGSMYAVFYTPEQAKVYQAHLKGAYDGMGFEVQMSSDYSDAVSRMKHRTKPTGNPDDEKPDAPQEPVKIPELRVIAVVPGGAADKAGLKIGDRIDSIDGKWILSEQKVDAFRDQLVKARAKPYSDAVKKELEDIDNRVRHGLSISRARDQLLIPPSGEVKLGVVRGTTPIDLKIAPTSVHLDPLQKLETAYRLNFIEGADAALQSAPGDEITLDLRGDVPGDYAMMLKCLAVVGGQGDYGTLTHVGGGKPEVIRVAAGTPKFKKVTLLVDDTTRTNAEIFANCLKSKPFVTVEGKSGGAPVKVVWHSLDDGSGYTLPVGTLTAGGKA